MVGLLRLSWGPAPLPDMSIDPSSPYVYATQEIDFGIEGVTIEGAAVTLANGHVFSSNIPYSVPLPHAILTIVLGGALATATPAQSLCMQEPPCLPAQSTTEPLAGAVGAAAARIAALEGALGALVAAVDVQAIYDPAWTMNEHCMAALDAAKGLLP